MTDRYECDLCHGYFETLFPFNLPTSTFDITLVVCWKCKVKNERKIL